MKLVLSTAIAIVAVLVLAGFAALAPRVVAQPPAGGYVNTMSWYRTASGTQAILDMARPASDPAHTDLWLYFLLTPADVAAARTNPAVGTLSVAGSWNNLQVNPIAVNQLLAPGLVNPFSKQPVREALNYLVDREFMGREVTPGLGPMYAMYFRQSPDYGREAVFFSEIERQYAFNPTKGRAMIDAALLADPDYSFVNGQWLWRGTPVTLTVVIRIEDSLGA